MNIIKRGLGFVKRKLLPGNPPDFLIVGAQKSGTTSLHYYLTQHPNLLGSRPKEVGYFHNDVNFKKGKRWYHQFFKNISGKKDFLGFESTPENLYFPKAAERIKKEYPEIKIIILLRDPVKRAYSAWNMYRELMEKRIKQDVIKKILEEDDNEIIRKLYSAGEFPEFEAFIEAEMDGIRDNVVFSQPSILRRGIYYSQVKQYLDLFGKDFVKVIGFKDFTDNRQEVLNEILMFLNLPKSGWEFLNDEVKHVIPYKKNMSIEVIRRLEEFYKNYNRELFSLLGKELNW